MENGLTITQNDLISAVSGQGIGEIIKPLVREIYLFDSFIAGTSRLKDPSVLTRVAAGEKLTLRREESKFDDNAIVILTEAGEKLGYVPEKDNIVFARLMDAGKLLTAQIRSVEERKGFVQIGIGIYLVDF